MAENNYEKTNISGNDVKVGSTSYLKFFDNTSNKWERISGSGSPHFIISDLSSITHVSLGEAITKIYYSYSGSYITGSVYSGSSSKLFSLTMNYDISGSLISVIRS
jgi:hypothetical protein